MDHRQATGQGKAMDERGWIGHAADRTRYGLWIEATAKMSRLETGRHGMAGAGETARAC
jgi:hypothetical protein